MKMDLWILLVALIFWILGSLWSSSILNFLGWMAIIAEIGYILIKAV